MAMSQKEYVEKKGVKCPFCGGGDLEGHEVEIDGGGAHQEINCLDCHAAWNDQYVLVGYQFTETPDPEDLPDGVREITPDEQGESMTHFVVSGRIPGDDGDTTLILCLREGISRADVALAFENEIYASRSFDRHCVFKRFGQAVIINSICKSAAPIEEI